MRASWKKGPQSGSHLRVQNGAMSNHRLNIKIHSLEGDLNFIFLAYKLDDDEMLMYLFSYGKEHSL